MADRTVAIQKKDGRRATFWTYDVLRLFAMSLVALQHLLSIADVNTPLVTSRLSLGQFGVSLFCGLSGLLAVRSGERGVWPWLMKRFAKIYPPYWVALSAVLAANALVHYKPMSVGLVLSEYLGTGYFTHGGQVIGAPFWFVSLILVCYGLAAAVRWDVRFLLPAAAVAGVYWFIDALFAAHIVSFLVGMVLALARQPRLVGAALGVGFGALAVVLNQCFAYPAVAAAAVLSAGATRGKSPPALSWASGLTYEYFLVHGAVYLGLARLLKVGLIENMLLGTTAAVLAACLVRAAAAFGGTSASYIAAALKRAFRRPVSAAPQPAAVCKVDVGSPD